MFSAIYMVVALALLVRKRSYLPGIIASLWRGERPSSDLQAAAAGAED